MLNYYLKLSDLQNEAESFVKFENEDYYFLIYKIVNDKYTIIKNRNHKFLENDGIFKICNGEKS